MLLIFVRLILSSSGVLIGNCLVLVPASTPCFCMSLLTLVLLALIFLFRIYSGKKKKYLLLVVYGIFLVLISVYSYFLRIYLFGHIGSYLPFLFPLVFCAGTWQGLPDQPTASSDSIHSVNQDDLWKEVEKGEQAGPSHQGGGSSIVRNSSLEASMHSRVLRLGATPPSPYLLDRAGVDYWADVKSQLDSADSQREYYRRLDFESRDLQIREKRTECLALFNEILEKNPRLANQAPYKTKEVLDDFFDERGDLQGVPALERDRQELDFLNGVKHQLQQNGPSFVKQLFNKI